MPKEVKSSQSHSPPVPLRNRSMMSATSSFVLCTLLTRCLFLLRGSWQYIFITTADGKSRFAKDFAQSRSGNRKLTCDPGASAFPHKFSNLSQSKSGIMLVIENTSAASGRVQGALWHGREHLPRAWPREPDWRAHRL